MQKPMDVLLPRWIRDSDQSSRFPAPRLLASWIALACLSAAQPAAATCLGCPPVGWDAEVTLVDGTVHRGWLVLSHFLVEDEVDLTAPPDGWRGYGPKKLQLWTETAAAPNPVPGHVLRPLDPEAEPEHAEIRVPRRAILLIGDPTELDAAEISIIRDAGDSGLQPAEKVRSPVFFITARQAAGLGNRPSAALQLHMGEDVIYCFWMKEAPPLGDQLEGCNQDNAFTRHDVMAGGSGRQEEPPDEGLLVLLQWGGT